MIVWFTGLSGSGKTTLGLLLCSWLKEIELDYLFLDGDLIRHIEKNQDFTRSGRSQHIKNVIDQAVEAEKNGLIVIVCLVSPFLDMRQLARSKSTQFFEVYMCASLEICEKRDVKGLYKKARLGIINNFTGIDQTYEPPQSPELKINSEVIDIQTSVALLKKAILSKLKK